MGMRSVGLLLWVGVLAGPGMGCGGPAFEVGGDSGTASTLGPGSGSGARGDASTPLDSSTDAPSEGGLPGSADAANDGAAPCAPLAAGTTDVYVDQRFTGTPAYGTAACPLPTIAQGTAAAAGLMGAVTVHVAGASPRLVYAETAPVTVASTVVLLGDGSASTAIHASGTCGTGTCAVMVSAAGVLDGFTVLDTGGDGILALAGTLPPTIRNTSANGNKGWGITAQGAVELGPNFSANSNDSGGLESPVNGGGRLHVFGTGDTFDDNTGNGINVDGPAFLVFEGGSASGNGQGIRLAGTPGPSGSPHVITGLTANGNTGPGGVVAYFGQTITMRSSRLLGNTSIGLVYDYVNGSTLDIGSSESGGNVFGGATVSMRNGTAGIRLCGAPATVTASGDSWVSCPPTETLLACGTALTTTYSDIVYAPAGAATVIAATSCSTGP